MVSLLDPSSELSELPVSPALSCPKPSLKVWSFASKDSISRTEIDEMFGSSWSPLSATLVAVSGWTVRNHTMSSETCRNHSRATFECTFSLARRSGEAPLMRPWSPSATIALLEGGQLLRQR